MGETTASLRWSAPLVGGTLAGWRRHQQCPAGSLLGNGHRWTALLVNNATVTATNGLLTLSTAPTQNGTVHHRQQRHSAGHADWNEQAAH